MKPLYIVTGGNGHLGNTVIRKLRELDFPVRALILPKDSEDLLKSLNCDIIKGDMRDSNTLDALFKHESDQELIVIHTAGIVSITQKEDKMLYDVNVNGTKKVTDYALRHHVKRYIYVSSVHAIPEKENSLVIDEVNHFDPNLVKGSYAKSKAIATQYVLDKVGEGLNAIVVHPSGIIGPYDYGRAHMTMMIEDYMNGYLTSRVDGAYDFVDVRDVAKGILQAVEHGRIGQCYILSGKRVELKEMFEKLRIISGRKYKINVLPMWFAKISAPLAELFYRLRKLPPIYTKYSLYTLKSNSYFSSEKAKNEFGYETQALDNTFIDAVMWLNERKRLKRKKILLFIKKYKPIHS